MYYRICLSIILNFVWTNLVTHFIYQYLNNYILLLNNNIFSYFKNYIDDKYYKLFMISGVTEDFI